MNKQKILAITAASFALLSLATFGLQSAYRTVIFAQTPETAVEQRSSGNDAEIKSDKQSIHKEDKSNDLHEESDGNTNDREVESSK